MPLVLFRTYQSYLMYEVSEEDLRQTIYALAEYHQEHGNPESVKLTLSKDSVVKELLVHDILVDLEDFR